MKRMQVLQPLIKELREKYKDDMQRLQKETMKLYTGAFLAVVQAVTAQPSRKLIGCTDCIKKYRSLSGRRHSDLVALIYFF